MPKPLPFISNDDFARFWNYVDKNGPIPAHRPELGPCWIWTGAKNQRGYGVFELRGFTARATRVAHYILFDEDPWPLDVMHDCDNPSCVRHIRKGTQLQNMADAVARGRMPTGDRNGSQLYPERLVRGELHHNSKTSDEEVRRIRELYRSGLSVTMIAAGFGISVSTACDQITGRGRETAPGPIQRIRRQGAPRGNRNAGHIPSEIALAIQKEAASGVLMDREIAVKYGVSKSMVGKIRRKFCA